MGHMQRVRKVKTTQQAQTAQMTEQQKGDHEEELYMVTQAENALAVKSASLWLIDSGCSNHMSHNLEIFKSLDKSCTSKVRIGNGDLLAVKGKGTAVVQTVGQKTRKINLRGS